MNKQLYSVISEQVQVDGKLVRAGDEVELTETQAEYLLDVGAIAPRPVTPSSPAPATTKPTAKD
jgi:hypothetical protein